MKNKFSRGIRTKITFVTISFTLIVTVSLVSISFYLFQSFMQQRLFQSTEFNLQLISGTISQYATSLDVLGEWCTTNSSIISYLQDTKSNPQEEVTTYQQLKEEFQSSRANQYVQRMIVFDANHTKMLQLGNIVEDTEPVTIYNLNRLFENAADPTSNSWKTIRKDPYDWQQSDSPNIIPVIKKIFYVPTMQVIGYVYMEVSTRLITDQIVDYALPSDSHLYINLGEHRYLITNGTFSEMSTHQIKSQKLIKYKDLNTNTRAYTIRFTNGSSGTFIQYPVQNMPISLMQSLSKQQETAQRIIFGGLVLIIGIVIIGLGVFITFYLYHLITIPISKMQKKIKAISSGDFTHDPSIEWDNELGEVGRGINRLSRDVVDLMESRLAHEKQKQDLEYQMLQSQITPHFIYNTLNSIKWMATIQGVRGIAEMTTSLSRLLKNISKGTKQLIFLREELQFLDDYFLIQQYRFGGAIVLKKDIDEAVLGSIIPKFTLQPLVENAIVHGIEPKGGAGIVSITARRKADESLEITIEDDGVGISQKEIREIFSDTQTDTSGMFHKIGVWNVNKRIQYEFGDQYGITLESEPGTYTRVTIHLPFVCPAVGGENQ